MASFNFFISSIGKSTSSKSTKYYKLFGKFSIYNIAFNVFKDTKHVFTSEWAKQNYIPIESYKGTIICENNMFEISKINHSSQFLVKIAIIFNSVDVKSKLIIAEPIAEANSCISL